jgi:prepilin-type N-terminal cleavage/methylation domain-containing protein
MQKNMQHNPRSGFTLVELSIVLVIIGLIVSGILVGQDMIRAAEIRSTVSQIESYNTAVNTFRDKYRNIPGDMLQTDAARFGFISVGGRTGAPGLGDGNRLVHAGAVAVGNPFTERYLGGETALFWRDLSQANLIGDNFSTAGVGVTETANAAQVASFLPAASIGQGHYFTVHAQNGRNHFSISQVQAVNAGDYTLGTAMTPQTAFNIDDKVDDSNPVSGTVVATWDPVQLGVVYAAGAAPGLTVALPAAATAAGAALDAGSCVSGATLAAAAYVTVTDAQANRPACQLRIRASF